MDIEKQVLIRTLVETAVAQVVRIPEIVTGDQAFAAIGDRLIAQEAIEEFDRFRDNYLYDGWFQWIHGEPCLLIDLNWKDIGSAVYQLKSLGWTDLEAFRVARRGPLVANEMSITDKEAILSLISSEKTKEAAAEPKSRKRSGTDL